MRNSIDLTKITPDAPSLIGLSKTMMSFVCALRVIQENRLESYDSIALVQRSTKKNISKCNHVFHGEMLRLIHMGRIKKVTVEFNDIKFNVDRYSTIKSIDSYFKIALAKRRDAYFNSPEGKQAEKELEEERNAWQEKADCAVAELETLDFSDYDKVLDVICRIATAINEGEAQVPAMDIIKKFNDHGFEVGMNLGISFDAHTKGECIKYIIGQFLHCLLIDGPIHMVAVFRNKLERRFVSVPV